MYKIALLITLLLAACAPDSETQATPPSHDAAGAPAAEPLTFFSCQTTADRVAKEYFQWYFNVSDSELHWYSEGYYQAGGAAFNQPVRARAYWQKSLYGTRTMRFDTCTPSVCTYYATYTCGCDGNCNLR